MHDPALVRGLEALGDRLEHRHRLAPRQRPARDAFGQRLARHQLHDQEAGRALTLEAMERRDVGVVEGGEDSSFALEPRQPLGIVRQLRGQDLDRDLAPEPRVAGAVHLAHPAPAERARGPRIRRGECLEPGAMRAISQPPPAELSGRVARPARLSPVIFRP